MKYCLNKFHSWLPSHSQGFLYKILKFYSGMPLGVNSTYNPLQSPSPPADHIKHVTLHHAIRTLAHSIQTIYIPTENHCHPS